MNPDIFFKNFELLSYAPNGVQKLRELILQLAVMGKLVPQDPNDKPASILVERIKAEKKRLDKKGKNNGSKQLYPVTKDDIQFEAPNNWEIVRLGQVYDIEYGKSLSEKNRNNEGEFPVYGSNGIVGFHNEYLVDKPSLIIGRKGSAGAVNLSNKPFWPIDTTYFVTPKEGLDLFFSYYLFKTLDLGKFNKATAIPGLNRQDAYELIIKIPPLGEQKRIVSKVDELMILCDKLEAHRQKKQEIQSKLNSAALDRMLSAENQEEFEQNRQRICENFDLLYDNPENVEKLKQAILQLAVQGKLAPQNPEDEPASVLIEKIQVEKKRLVKEGKIKEIKISPPLDATEIAY
jgi:type I restriction enzyme S subunit